MDSIFICVAPNKVVRAALNRVIHVLSIGVREVVVAAPYAWTFCDLGKWLTQQLGLKSEFLDIQNRV